MKLKLVTIVRSVVLFLVTSPLMAQTDPGVDPDAIPPAPIDGYVWVLALVGFIYIFRKLKVIQNKNIQNQIAF